MRPSRRSRPGSVFAALVLVLLGFASSAAALTISGGPAYVAGVPGGGSCSVSGTPCFSGGANVTCSGLSPGAVSNLYYGLRVDQYVSGDSEMGNAGPAATSAEVFRISSVTS